MMRLLALAQELVLQCTASDNKERPLFAGILETLERLRGEAHGATEGRE